MGVRSDVYFKLFVKYSLCSIILYLFLGWQKKCTYFGRHVTFGDIRKTGPRPSPPPLPTCSNYLRKCSHFNLIRLGKTDLPLPKPTNPPSFGLVQMNFRYSHLNLTRFVIKPTSHIPTNSNRPSSLNTTRTKPEYTG